MKKTFRPWIIAAAILLLLAGATLFYKTVHFYTTEYDLLPTCTAEGGHYRRCALCRRVQQVTSVPPTGHKQEWFTVKEATSATEGIEELRCSVCNILLSTKRTAMKNSPIPSLYLHGSGMGMSATQSILARFLYRSNETESEELTDETGEEAAPTTDENGNPIPTERDSSGTTRVRLMDDRADFDKKLSYVLNDFEVGEGQPPLFGDFGQSDEIRIHANNDDTIGVRRIVSYGQWRDIVAANYPDYARFISASDDTQYAGYNFLLYIRNQKPTYTFMGIYTLSIPYVSLVRKNLPDVHCILYQYGDRLDYVYGDAENEGSARESFDSFLRCSSDSLAEHTDLDILTDYCAFSLMIGNGDAFSDLYWVSPDGVLWYPVPNNTEHTYGSCAGTIELSDSRELVVPTGIFGRFYGDNTESVLRRVSELKRGRLSPEKIKAEFMSAISKLDTEVYREDCSLNNAPFRDPKTEVEKLTAWYTEHLDRLR